MLRVSLVVLGFAALGCVAPHSSSRSVSGPGGAGYRSIECAGSQQECFEKAARVCPNGYELATSGGASDTSGGVSGGYGSVSSVYKGHMLIRCNTGPVVYRRVHSRGCAFKVPRDWVMDPVDGSDIYHPSHSYDFQVAADSSTFNGSLHDWAAKNFAGYKLEDTELEAGSAVLLTKADELNSLRMSTVLFGAKGRVYEVSCASRLTDSLSPVCATVLRSASIDDE